MTMRLDIVTNDAGELVRREHARELGAGVVVAIYRLTKLAQMHDLGNQAFLRQLEQTHQLIGEYCLRSGSNLSVLFADKATFVAGQLLKANRASYEMATELGDFLGRIGGSELHISRDLTREDLNAFSEQVSLYHRTGSSAGLRLPPKIHLRQVADAARLRGIELEALTADQRIVRAYASAVVIMRRFFEDLAASRYVLPRRIKRIAQSLVDLSDASTAAFLGVTEVRNANYDEAGRAVNTSILAVSIARESTSDRTSLSQIAMAAMMHDVARPRALALAGAGGAPMPGMAAPSSLSEDQEDRLAAGAAAVLTALGRVNEPSITRTVLTFEALWLRRKQWLGPVYWGARPPTLHASIIAIARRYNDLLTPEPGLQPPTTDFAVAQLASELAEPQDRTVLRMLVSALGLLPTGTVIQLSTGEVAEVVRGSRGLGDRPRVRFVADANGQPFAQPVELELAQDPRRTVHRVLSVDGWQKGLEQGPQAPPPGPESDEDVIVSVPPPAANNPLNTTTNMHGSGQHQQFAGTPAVPPPANPSNPAQISPLSPVLKRSIADKYADQYAAWGDQNQSNEREAQERAAADRGGGGGGDRAEQTGRSDSGSASGEHPASASMPSLGSSPSAVAEAMGRMINDSLRPPAMPPREVDRPDRTVFQPANPDDVPPQPRLSGTPSREPTARGNLAATPLPHVLVYMLDHALTGSVIFEGTNANGTDDTIYFVSGVPAKIRLGDVVALLGAVLVEDGSLEAKAVDQAVEGARRLGILIGEYLVGHDLVTREALAWGLEGQLLRKIAHVANLAPEIQYAYYRDVDLLEGWGGEIVVGHPLNPILASVRHWSDRARVRATLNRIGKHPLVLHPDSDLSNIAVIAEEQKVLDAVRAQAMPLAQLFKQKLADEEVVSSLVYSLAVTRQFAFKGQKKGPMAARGAAWRSINPGSGSVIPSDMGGGSTSSSERRAAALSSSQSIPMTTATPSAVSGSRPAMPVAKPAAAATASGSIASTQAPETPRGLGPSGLGPPSRVGPPSAQMRTAPPVTSTPARAMTPAARPSASSSGSSSGSQSAARPSAPQIRQVKKSGAPTQTGNDIRPPPQSSRNIAAAAPVTGSGTSSSSPSSPAQKHAAADGAPASHEGKTVALASPSLKDIIAKRPPAAPPPPAASSRSGASSSSSGSGAKPMPGLPSRNNTPAAAGGKPPNLPTGAKASVANVSASSLSPNTKEIPTQKISEEVLASAREAAAAAAATPSAAPSKPKMSVTGPNPKAASPTGTGKTQPAKPPPDEDFSDETGRVTPKAGVSAVSDDGGRSDSDKKDESEKVGAIEIGEAGIADAEAALEAMTSFRLAEGALQRNDTAAAEEHAKKAVAGDPTQVDYISLLAWIRAIDGAPQVLEDAIRTMSKVLIEDPSNERALFYRGKLLVRTNRLPEALHDFNELLSANPSHKEAQAEVKILKPKVTS